jgi:hypothetical protein
MLTGLTGLCEKGREVIEAMAGLNKQLDNVAKQLNDALGCRPNTVQRGNLLVQLGDVQSFLEKVMRGYDAKKQAQ